MRGKIGFRERGLKIRWGDKNRREDKERAKGVGDKMGAGWRGEGEERQKTGKSGRREGVKRGKQGERGKFFGGGPFWTGGGGIVGNVEI